MLVASDAALLWFFACLAVATAAFVIECVLYFGLVGPYYRFGPPLKRQTWRTDVSMSEAATAVEQALTATRLAWRCQTNGAGTFFSARKGAMLLSMWPRFVLRVEEDAASRTAVITCEARPFLSLLLFLPPWFMRKEFLVPGLLVIAMIVAGYLGFWLWELRLREIKQVRQQLAGIGVKVCPACGYDIRATPERCPECGMVQPELPGAKL